MGGSSSSAAAASILRELFQELPDGFRARLWDGTEVGTGSAPAPCTFVFRDPATFRRIVLRPRTRTLAEAFLDGRLDVEGDLFSAIQIGSALRDVRPSTLDRFRILLRLVRV